MSDTVQSGSGISSPPPIPLEKPPHELELDRKKALLARVRLLRESAIFQRGSLQSRNPLKEYCWVNIRPDRRVTFEGLGWQLCKDPLVTTSWRQDDNTHVRGDLILYDIDKDLYEAMEAYNVLRGLEASEGVEHSFLSALQREHVPAYKPKL